jgi:hypothetical protein
MRRGFGGVAFADDEDDFEDHTDFEDADPYGIGDDEDDDGEEHEEDEDLMGLNFMQWSWP